MRSLTVFLVMATVTALSGPLSASAEGMKPGLWEVTSKTKMGGGGKPIMPEMTPEQMAKMKSMGVKMPNMADDQVSTIRHCVTKEQAEKNMPPAAKDSNGMHCEQQDVKKQGTKISWKIQCTGKQNVTGSGSMDYDSPAHYTGTSSMTMDNPEYGPMTMSHSFSGKWLSVSCK